MTLPRLDQLEAQVRVLTARVAELEKKNVKTVVPLKKRVKTLLDASNNNLYEAREAAKNQGDTESVQAIEQLMDRVT